MQQGDHLTRAEFELRYEAMPDLKIAELIEGVVHMPSPVRWNDHAGPHADLIGWQWHYRAFTTGVRVGDSGSVRLDLDNMPQPDGTMIILPSHGGQAKLSADDYIEGAPEQVAEIAASTVSIDLHTKLRVYRRNNVLEYMVWRVEEKAIDWFLLRQGQYERLPVTGDGIYQSVVFPGLWLDPAAMARGDMATVLRVLQQGIASPEHAAFVAKLQAVAAARP